MLTVELNWQGFVQIVSQRIADEERWFYYIKFQPCGFPYSYKLPKLMGRQTDRQQTDLNTPTLYILNRYYAIIGWGVKLIFTHKSEKPTYMDPKSFQLIILTCLTAGSMPTRKDHLEIPVQISGDLHVCPSHGIQICLGRYVYSDLITEIEKLFIPQCY